MLKKLLLLAVVFGAGFFSFYSAPKALASNYSQVNQSGDFTTQTTPSHAVIFTRFDDNSTTTVYSSNTAPAFHTASTTVFSSSFATITKVSLIVGVKSLSSSPVLQAVVNCTDTNGNHQTTSDSEIPAATSTIARTFTFSTPATCDSTTLTGSGLIIYVYQSGGVNDNLNWQATDNANQLTQDVDVVDSNAFGTIVPGYNFSLVINGQILGVNAFLGGLNKQATLAVCPSTDFQFQGIDFGQGLCRFWQFVAVPDNSSVSSFSGLWTTLSAKPPFGWFDNAVTPLSSISTSTPASSSPVSLNPLAPIINPIDLGLAALALAAFVFTIFRRLKGFNF